MGVCDILSTFKILKMISIQPETFYLLELFLEAIRTLWNGRRSINGKQFSITSTSVSSPYDGIANEWPQYVITLSSAITGTIWRIFIFFLLILDIVWSRTLSS